MANTYTQIAAHIVFSTQHRQPSLEPEARSDLYAYMGGILRNLGGKSIRINGMRDHVHVLTFYPSKRSLSDLVRDLKSNSSSWLMQTQRCPRFDGWQTGFGAFSVSKDVIPRVASYIDQQENHHRNRTFDTEFTTMLQRAGIDYDERYVLD